MSFPFNPFTGNAMTNFHSVIIKPRVIVVDVSMHCIDQALLDAAGGAIYGAYHYDEAAPVVHEDGSASYVVYPLAVTPLRAIEGFSAERALGEKHARNGMPIAAEYLNIVSERFGPPQVFPDVLIGDQSDYQNAYANILNSCLAQPHKKVPLWVSQIRNKKVLRVRQKTLASKSEELAPEHFLIDYLTADGARASFGVDMRNHVDLSLPRPASAAGWSTPAEILCAIEKQFSRCADVNRDDYEAFEVFAGGRLLRESFFWARAAGEDEVLQVRSTVPGSGRFTLSYISVSGIPYEIDLRIAVNHGAGLLGSVDWLDIAVAIEEECMSYPGFDADRYSVIEISDGARTQTEMFLPQRRHPQQAREAA
jgi:hypothetical protein